ncbi:MAG TPA: inositol monophosphatase family protein [Anaerolineales bacterium]|nr:inositol monophosphatase family protein [Anaerolineales bacterium]
MQPHVHRLAWFPNEGKEQLGVFRNLQVSFGTAGRYYRGHMVSTGRAEIFLDPGIKIWDVAPFPPIFREAGGFFGSWKGKEGHTHGEGLAVNAALKSKVLKLMRV